MSDYGKFHNEHLGRRMAEPTPPQRFWRVCGPVFAHLLMGIIMLEIFVLLWLGFGAIEQAMKR